MKHLIKQTISHPLISGSAVIFLGSNIANALNFLFILLMGRYLGDADFGVLSSLNSLLTLPLLVATAMTPIVVNFAAELFAKDEIDMVHGFYNKISKYYLSVSTTLLVLYFLFLNSIAHFFHISDVMLVLLTGVIAFIGLISTANMSFLQAKLAFLYISISVFIAASIRVVFGVLFVWAGFGVEGGIWATLLSSITLLLLSFYPLRFVFRRIAHESPIPSKELLSYGLPAALAILAMTSFISTDIFLVKHFFSPELAGIYAKLELIGKIVFFLTSSIATVMFPVVVQKRSRNENYHSTFILGILLVIIPSVLLTSVYFLFGDEILLLLYKNKSSLSYAALLGPFAIFMTLYSLVTLLVNFYLSLKKTKIVFPVVIVSLLQIVIIWFFHDSLQSVVSISTWLMLLLLISLLLYYPHATKK